MKKLKLLLLGIVGILGLGFSSATFEYSGNTYTDGVFHNPILGLITIIDGTGAWTMQDKNLGASQVYNYGDVFSYENVGNYYQYGNNYGFNAFSGSYSFTSSMPSDFSTYSPGTYSSDIVVYFNSWRPLSVNGNIWGIDSQILAEIQGPCPDGFHLPSDLGFDISHFATNPLEGVNLFKIPLYGIVIPLSESEPFYLDSAGKVGGFLLNTRADGDNFYQFLIQFYGSGSSKNKILTNYAPIYNWYNIRCYRDVALLPNNTWIPLTGSVDLLPPPEIDDGGNGSGSQDDINSVSTSYYEYNKAIIESAVWCYMTSGQYMDGSFIQGDSGCAGLNYVDFIEGLDVDVSSRYFDNVSKYGNLKFNNSSKVLYYYCVNFDSVSYPFCNNLDFYSSTYLIYSVVAQGSGSARLMYNIYGTGINVAIENNGTGLFGDTTCHGIWCSEVSTGSPTYIDTSYNEYTGYDFQYLPSIDSFNVENSTGFFFNCPYPYTKVFISMDNKIIDYLGGTKLGRVINCPISAFRYGYRTLIFGDLNGTGYYWDGHLFNGNTPGHRALFMFFDILLSFIIIVILVKFYKLLSK